MPRVSKKKVYFDKSEAINDFYMNYAKFVAPILEELEIKRRKKLAIVIVLIVGVPLLSYYLFHAERLLSYHCSISKHIDIICSGRKEFFYIPIYGNGLFFTGVFYIFLDGISQLTVFVIECIRFVFA